MIIASLKQALANKVVRFIFSRYFTYLIQFVNSLLIALYLGPYNLGRWGFITLVVQYFAQINFGIPHALNAIVSVAKHNEKYVGWIFNTVLTLTCILCLLVVTLFLATYWFTIDIGSQYEFKEFLPLVCGIVVLNYCNSIFSNLFRVYNKLFEIAFSQSVFPCLMLAAVLFGNGEQLLNYLVAANLIAFFVSFALFFYNSPVKIKPMFPLGLVKIIARRALFLFIYNSSFYLIMISTRSIVSSFYSVTEFGFFTFSFTLANVILLLFESFSFLIYPKTINRLSKAGEQESINILEKIRTDFLTMSHGVVHIVILSFPIFILFFPSYSTAVTGFRLIALTLVLYTNCFGYSSLLVAKGKERLLAYTAALSLILNLGLGFFFAGYINVSSDLVILSTTITYLVYLLLINYSGRKLLKVKNHFLQLVASAFPVRILVPYCLAMFFTILKLDSLWYISSFAVYILLNRSTIFGIFSLLREIIAKPDIINI